MTNKIWNGLSWKTYKNLKIFSGDWKNATKGWIWNGTNWKQFYPEYPLNTVAPSVSGTATQGNSLSCTTGSWNSDLAFSPISYSYQWRRGSSDISGATNSTYSTVVADVGNQISCRVTATNNRGPTPAVSSNSITVTSALPGPPSGLTITNSTAQPGAFTASGSSTSTAPTITMGANTNVGLTTGTINWSSTNQSSWSSNGTFSGSGTTETSVAKTGLSSGTTYSGTVTVTGSGSTNASGSWTAPTNLSYYTYSTNTGTLTADGTNRTWSLSGGTVGGAYTVTVTAYNTSGIASISWTAGSNATSYDVYINGTFYQNTTNTSISYSWGTTGNLSVNVRSKNSTGAETTGVSGSATISANTRSAQASGNFASAQTASAPYSLTTSAAVIPTVSNLDNNSISQTTIGMTWSSTNQASWSFSGFPGGAGGTSGSNANTSTTITNLSANTDYYPMITVTSSTGNTASLQYYDSFEGVSYIRTLPADETQLPAPTGISATRYTALACQETVMTWNAVTNAATYDVFRTTSSTVTTPGTPTTTGITDTFYSVSSSASAWYWVRAVRASGQAGAWSARITPTTNNQAVC